MKTIKAVEPFSHSGFLNFKIAPFQAWNRNGGRTAKAHYPFRIFHSLAYHYEIPSWMKTDKEARLRFMEPVSLYFDTFPDYALYEVIPMVWDCWPCYFEKMCRWIEKHHVKTAIFTSSQTADRMKQRFPELKVMWCPEAVNSSNYKKGKELKERRIDLLQFGRSNDKILKSELPENVNHICTKVNGKFIYNNEELYTAMGDTKVTIALPRSITQPEKAGDIETLTQRYWENMLSRIVMVGKAPKELTELIGYNPVIEIEPDNFNNQLLRILEHIDDYQELVNRNRESALQYGNWNDRMKDVMFFLKENGYDI